MRYNSLWGHQQHPILLHKLSESFHLGSVFYTRQDTMVHTIFTKLLQPLAFIVSLHPGALPSEKAPWYFAFGSSLLSLYKPHLSDLAHDGNGDLYAYDGHLELPGQKLQIPRTIWRLNTTGTAPLIVYDITVASSLYVFLMHICSYWLAGPSSQAHTRKPVSSMVAFL